MYSNSKIWWSYHRGIFIPKCRHDLECGCVKELLMVVLGLYDLRLRGWNQCMSNIYTMFGLRERRRKKISGEKVGGRRRVPLFGTTLKSEGKKVLGGPNSKKFTCYFGWKTGELDQILEKKTIIPFFSIFFFYLSLTIKLNLLQSQ